MALVVNIKSGVPADKITTQIKVKFRSPDLVDYDDDGACIIDPDGGVNYHDYLGWNSCGFFIFSIARHNIYI